MVAASDACRYLNNKVREKGTFYSPLVRDETLIEDVRLTP